MKSEASEFLTEIDLAKAAGTSLAPGIPPVQPSTPLHLEPNISGEDRISINTEIETSVLKEKNSSIVADAVSSLQGKLANVPKSPMDKIKDIIAKGNIQETYEVCGFKWTLKTLDQEDRIAIYDHADIIAAKSGKIPAIALLTVAYSIEALDGASVYTWFPDVTIESCNNNKYALVAKVRQYVTQYIKSFPDFLIDELYSKILILEDSKKTAMESIKNS